MALPYKANICVLQAEHYVDVVRAIDTGGLGSFKGFRTNVPKIYAPADSRHGKHIIVSTISESWEAARKIERELIKSTLNSAGENNTHGAG